MKCLWFHWKSTLSGLSKKAEKTGQRTAHGVSVQTNKRQQASCVTDTVKCTAFQIISGYLL